MKHSTMRLAFKKLKQLFPFSKKWVFLLVEDMILDSCTSLLILGGVPKGKAAKRRLRRMKRAAFEEAPQLPAALRLATGRCDGVRARKPSPLCGCGSRAKRNALVLFFRGVGWVLFQKRMRPIYYFSIRFRYCPVKLAGQAATSSGVPVTTMVPPPSPPSGPRSMR